jgi:hypothetical protein
MARKRPGEGESMRKSRLPLKNHHLKKMTAAA